MTWISEQSANARVNRRMLAGLAVLVLLIGARGSGAAQNDTLPKNALAAGFPPFRDIRIGPPRTHPQGARPDAILGEPVDAPAAEAPRASDDENLAMGNPSGATADDRRAENYLLWKKEYVLSYNNTTHNPNWVSWHLNSTWIGDIGRAGDFRPDTSLPGNWIAVTEEDYDHSGFDRGHMCNSKDRTRDRESNSATFLMTNMVPQSPKNNQETWNNLEIFSRDLAEEGNELYIVSGPAGRGGVGRIVIGRKPTRTVEVTRNKLPIERDGAVVGEIVVPQCVWKVILALPRGKTSPRDVTAGATVIAVIMPNRHSIDADWRSYTVSVSQVEALTRYKFFSAVEEVNPLVASQLKQKNASPSPTRCDEVLTETHSVGEDGLTARHNP